MWVIKELTVLFHIPERWVVNYLWHCVTVHIFPYDLINTKQDV